MRRTSSKVYSGLKISSHSWKAMSSSISRQSTSDSNFLNPGGGFICNSWRLIFFVFGSSLLWRFSSSPSLLGCDFRFFVILNRFFVELLSWLPFSFLFSSFVARAPMFYEKTKALGTHSQLVTFRSRLGFEWKCGGIYQIKDSRHVPKSCSYITLTNQSWLLPCGEKQMINAWSRCYIIRARCVKWLEIRHVQEPYMQWKVR